MDMIKILPVLEDVEATPTAAEQISCSCDLRNASKLIGEPEVEGDIGECAAGLAVDELSAFLPEQSVQYPAGINLVQMEHLVRCDMIQFEISCSM